MILDEFIKKIHLIPTSYVKVINVLICGLLDTGLLRVSYHLHRGSAHANDSFCYYFLFIEEIPYFKCVLFIVMTRLSFMLRCNYYGLTSN